MIGIAGTLGVVLLVMVCLLWGGTRASREGEQYADAVIPKIVSRWELAQVESRAYQPMTATERAQGKALFRKCKTLGKLKTYYGAHGHAVLHHHDDVSRSIGTDTVIIGEYIARADFQAGPADITLRLVKIDERWRISGITVNSDVFFR